MFVFMYALFILVEEHVVLANIKMLATSALLDVVD